MTRPTPEIYRAETKGDLSIEVGSWAEAYFDERGFSERLIGAIIARQHFRREREAEIEAEAAKVEAAILEAQTPKRRRFLGLF